MSDKFNLRTSAKIQRITFRQRENGDLFRKYSEAIAAHIATVIQTEKARRVFSFYPTHDEPDFSSIFFSTNVQWFFPKVVNQNIEFFHCGNFESLSPGAFNIMEPIANEGSQLPNDRSDVVLTPGLLFDSAGFRLGYGGGFYDRFFERLSLGTNHQDVSRIFGVCFSEFLLNQPLPREEHDFRVHAIVTERGVFEASTLN